MPSGSQVKVDQMPKGVEHTVESIRVLRLLNVKVDQMPKGVEHSLSAS